VELEAGANAAYSSPSAGLCEGRATGYILRMELWQQIDWKHRLERSSVTTFARTFRVKLGKLDVLDAIAPPLCRSRYWITFDQNLSVYGVLNDLVEHLVETYGLGVVMKNGALHNISGDRSWELPDNAQQAALVMAALKQAEPMLDPRPYVHNGSSDTLSWAVFSSGDWAELEAVDLYAIRALFPLKGKVPKRPTLPKGAALRRQRDPSHETLLAWVSANKDQLMPQLVDALDKLETSHPDSPEESDALSQIYRIGRRARR
jgi:hypothetical protein